MILIKICLILSESFSKDAPSRPAVIEIYGNCLPARGHKIIWVAPSKENKNNIIEDIYLGVKIFTVSYPFVPNFPLRILKYIIYIYNKFRIISKILNDDSFDIIQTRNSVLDSMMAVYFKNKYKIKFVFQYSFPKESYKYSTKKLDFFSGKIQHRFMKYVLNKADLILPISKWMEIKLLKEGFPKSKMMPLPMGINSSWSNCQNEEHKLEEKYRLGNSKVILYVGTLHELRMLDMIIEAFSIVKNIGYDVKLLIVGDGNDKLHLQQLSESLGHSENVIFAGKVPYSNMPKILKIAAIALCPVPPLDIYLISSPTKLFEYMIMGIPIVANEEIPEQREVVEESCCGALAKFNAESFASKIIELLNNPVKATDMGINGQKWVLRNRSYECMAIQVEKRYFELLKIRE